MRHRINRHGVLSAPAGRDFDPEGDGRDARRSIGGALRKPAPRRRSRVPQPGLRSQARGTARWTQWLRVLISKIIAKD